MIGVRDFITSVLPGNERSFSSARVASKSNYPANADTVGWLMPPFLQGLPRGERVETPDEHPAL